RVLMGVGSVSERKTCDNLFSEPAAKYLPFVLSTALWTILTWRSSAQSHSFSIPKPRGREDPAPCIVDLTILPRLCGPPSCSGLPPRRAPLFLELFRGQAVPVGVLLDVGLPLLRNVVLGEDGLHRALGFAGAAVDALI